MLGDQVNPTPLQTQHAKIKVPIDNGKWIVVWDKAMLDETTKFFSSFFIPNNVSIISNIPTSELTNLDYDVFTMSQAYKSVVSKKEGYMTVFYIRYGKIKKILYTQVLTKEMFSEVDESCGD